MSGQQYRAIIEADKVNSPEWEATNTLDNEVADARLRMGESRWNELVAQWEDET